MVSELSGTQRVYTRPLAQVGPLIIASAKARSVYDVSAPPWGASDGIRATHPLSTRVRGTIGLRSRRAATVTKKQSGKRKRRVPKTALRLPDPEGNPIELWQPRVADTKG